MARYDCTDFKVMLSAYLDGEIEMAERTNADRHLIECTSCRALLESAERTDSAIRLLAARDPVFAEKVAEAIPLPSSFEQGVFDRTRRRRQMHSLRLYRSLGLLATAASIVLGAALFVVVRASRDRSVDAPSNLVNDGEWETLPEDVQGPPQPPRDSTRAVEPRAIIMLSDAETQALHTSATTIASIVNTPFEDVAARDRLVQIVVYDDLVERLGAIRSKVNPIARRQVDATRATLFQLLRDRPEVELWSQMQEDLRLLELSAMLESLADDSELRRPA
ncbi:MAG: zf-HC2 domain-containing protein [Phycisphaerae bacterium]|nr:zf-HC2 domain-containing protein [Phycisphaerae bacterium]